MYKLVYFVPHDFLEATKAAVFAAGAGQVGDYQECCWQIKGQGQFRPSPSASPFIGRSGQLETVEEYRVEMVCRDEQIRPAIEALKQAHPYEEPAYDVTLLADL